MEVRAGEFMRGAQSVAQRAVRRGVPNIKALLDLLFPRHCAACGADVDRPDSLVCWECFRSIELVDGPICSHCGLKVEGAFSHAFVCGSCHDHPPAFERARVAGRFQGVLRDLLLAFKYNGGVWLCRDLADLLHGCLLTHFDVAASAAHAAITRRRCWRTIWRGVWNGRIAARRWSASATRPRKPG
jgi:predicted amidophosphoribosyltransferase